MTQEQLDKLVDRVRLDTLTEAIGQAVIGTMIIRSADEGEPDPFKKGARWAADRVIGDITLMARQSKPNSITLSDLENL